MRILILFFVILFAQVAFAQEYPDWIPVDPVFVPPNWLEQLLLFINDVPGVGPVLVKVGQWAGVLAVVTTSLAVCAIAILKALKGFVKGSPDLEIYVKLIEEKVGPVVYWLKYVSLLNAQKPKAKTAGDIVAEKAKK